MVQQASLDFAIPFLDEDIPLYVDPFLLWKSPPQQDKPLLKPLYTFHSRYYHRVWDGREYRYYWLVGGGRHLHQDGTSDREEDEGDEEDEEEDEGEKDEE